VMIMMLTQTNQSDHVKELVLTTHLNLLLKMMSLADQEDHIKMLLLKDQNQANHKRKNKNSGSLMIQIKRRQMKLKSQIYFQLRISLEPILEIDISLKMNYLQRKNKGTKPSVTEQDTIALTVFQISMNLL